MTRRASFRVFGVQISGTFLPQKQTFNFVEFWRFWPGNEILSFFFKSHSLKGNSTETAFIVWVHPGLFCEPISTNPQIFLNIKNGIFSKLSWIGTKRAVGLKKELRISVFFGFNHIFVRRKVKHVWFLSVNLAYKCRTEFHNLVTWRPLLQKFQIFVIKIRKICKGFNFVWIKKSKCFYYYM